MEDDDCLMTGEREGMTAMMIVNGIYLSTTCIFFTKSTQNSEGRLMCWSPGVIRKVQLRLLGEVEYCDVVL